MSIGRIVQETWNGYNKHRLGDLAAMLTYYAIFALFPFAFALVDLTLLVLPTDVLDQGFKMVAFALPGSVSDFALLQLKRMEQAAGSGFAVLGFALAVWGSSRGAVALQTALNEIHEVKETRPWWWAQLVAISTTLLVSLLAIVALALLLVGPTVGHFLTDRFGLGAAFDVAYSVGRWLGAALLIMLVWACLYYFLPAVRRKFRWVTPGAIVGVLIWLLASRGFIFYTDHFGGYEKTYGTLGGVIVFLTWLWMSCMALLIGGEIDDALDEMRKEKEGGGGQVPVKQSEGQTAFPVTPEVSQMQIKTTKKKEMTVDRDTRIATAPREHPISDLARRVGDDLSTLAKNHFELARIEVAAGAKNAIADLVTVVLGGVLALIGLAMLCVTVVVAAEPIIAALWLRLLLGAILYVGAGGGLIYGFLQKMRGEPGGLEHTKQEAKRTVQVLKEQVHNG